MQPWNERWIYYLTFGAWNVTLSRIYHRIRSVCIQTGTKSNINFQGLIFEIWNTINMQRTVILSNLGMISGTFSDFAMVFTYSCVSFKLNWDTCSVNITLALSMACILTTQQETLATYRLAWVYNWIWVLSHRPLGKVVSENENGIGCRCNLR